MKAEVVSVFNHNVMKIYGRVKVNLHAFLGPLTSL
jgi:hypothetical protein